jgi:hypothetical protein
MRQLCVPLVTVLLLVLADQNGLLTSRYDAAPSEGTSVRRMRRRTSAGAETETGRPMTDQTDTMESSTAQTTVKPYVDEITSELEKRGLRVTVRLPTLTVRNPAAAGTDARGIMMSPGMTQDVRILDTEGRGPGWYWVWPGLRPGERGVPEPQPDIEFMCAADDIEFAAERISNVVRVHTSGEPG